MTKKLFDFDPISGIITWFEGDGEGGFKLTYEADVEANLDANTQLYNSGKNGWVSPDKELKWVADIPLILVHKWLVEEGIDVFNRNDWPAVKRRLNDGGWRKLRTSPGQI